MAALPASLRRLTPERLRDDVRLRAAAVGLGLIPPRTMHSEEDARVLLEAARGARRVVEIGVYEGSSAVALCETLGPDAELHLVDPFGAHPDALPNGWGATEWATRRVVARTLRACGPDAPSVHWHVALSHELAARWEGDVDMVFIDGDHSEAGCALDWSAWHGFVAPGGRVVFHDARADRAEGRGLPGPTVVVGRHFRAAEPAPGWEIDAEADRTVVVRRVA
ncbi:MAG TPA: class I SAM-dependent methyltransferase [Solirubrobacteraceae bacterium]|jgi:predicted O-methyltransferase YrrM